jgi:hypothetical protein
MSADYKQLSKFAKDLERLNSTQKEEFLQACCKELAARLLQKVIRKTMEYSDTGTLVRGWTVDTHEEAASGKKVGYKEWCDAVEVRKQGNTYILNVINPVNYASYVEYGHRTSNGAGWVEGKFTLTVAESEINAATDGILAKKLRNFIKEVFGE